MDRLFIEKNGKNLDRPQLTVMLNYVREGDLVYVTDLSRPARSTKDPLYIVERLDAKCVDLISMKENINIQTHFGRLLLTFLGAIYEFERANLLE